MANLFDPRVKLPIHLLQLFLVFVVLILSVVRMFNRPAGAPRSRAGTMSLGMSAKSLIILLYEILSSHVRAFKKWSSLKAYVILNGLEIVFWGAVVFLMIQANIKFCAGLSCTLSWVIVPLGIVMNILASYMTIVTWMDFRYFKETGVQRGSKYSASDAVEVESVDSDASGGRSKPRRKSTRGEEVLMTRQPAPRHNSHHQTRPQRAAMSPQRYENYRPHHSDDRRHHTRRHSHGAQRSYETYHNGFGDVRSEDYYHGQQGHRQQGHGQQGHGRQPGY
ncbi:hypothetical protein B0T10DRAFT_577477 [Thelonectria olida]|uniref:Uncharacterized protein n=1 Tax=Thelonectria olida TaxID=1576542 RepID=A0A9P8WD76_9HYPO|nr:hypothetical protein B0T10DRAFT_577477 [Thelonectria olida]